MKTRMQLQTKDREIKRLRKVVRHLQKDNSDHLEQLFSEMRSQVENVTKWIDLKSKAALSPHSSSLLRIALSRDEKYGDLYSSHESQLSISDTSSNQSTLERHHRRRESYESYLPSSTCPPSSCESSQVATPTTPVKERNYVGGDPDFHSMLAKSFIPPLSVESDTTLSNITKLLKESEAILNQPDSLDDSIKPSVAGTDAPDESVSHNPARYDLNDWRSTLATTSHRARTRSMSAPFVSTESSLSTAMATDTNDDANNVESAADADDVHTPSTVKSNTTSPKSSIQDPPTQPNFKYGNEVTAQQEQGPMADLIAVFRKIQGRDFLAQ